jgi:hypothetical protein
MKLNMPKQKQYKMLKSQNKLKKKKKKIGFDNDGDGVVDPIYRSPEELDKFNRGAWGEWSDGLRDLFNTRHGGPPGFAKYYDDLEPGKISPKEDDDIAYKV